MSGASLQHCAGNSVYTGHVEGEIMRRNFYPGDPVPWFVCRATNNPTFNFDTVAGRYIVMSFYGSAARENSAAVLRHITTTLRAQFDDANMAFFGVSADPVDESDGRVRQMEPGI